MRKMRRGVPPSLQSYTCSVTVGKPSRRKLNKPRLKPLQTSKHPLLRPSTRLGTEEEPPLAAAAATWLWKHMDVTAAPGLGGSVHKGMVVLPSTITHCINRVMKLAKATAITRMSVTKLTTVAPALLRCRERRRCLCRRCRPACQAARLPACSLAGRCSTRNPAVPASRPRARHEQPATRGGAGRKPREAQQHVLCRIRDTSVRVGEGSSSSSTHA